MPDKYISELLHLSTALEEDVRVFLEYIHGHPSAKSLEEALHQEVTEYASSIKERYQHKIATLFIHTSDELDSKEVNEARTVSAWAYSTVCAFSGDIQQSIYYLETALFRTANHQDRFMLYVEIAKLLNIKQYKDSDNDTVLHDHLQLAWTSFLEWFAEALASYKDVRMDMDCFLDDMIYNLIPKEIIIKSLLTLDMKGHRLGVHYYAILCYVFLKQDLLVEARGYLELSYMVIEKNDTPLRSFLQSLDHILYQKKQSN